MKLFLEGEQDIETSWVSTTKIKESLWHCLIIKAKKIELNDLPIELRKLSFIKQEGNYFYFTTKNK